MTELVKTKPIPALADLYNESSLAALGQANELNIILNADPKPAWIKSHPTVKVKDAQGNSVPLQYIPIGTVEYLLTNIFVRWWVEIKDTKLIANSVCVTVRLWVIDPVTGQAIFQDGIGASPIQIKANSGGAIDFGNMQSAAIQMAAPSAESYAVSDAADKFGRIFGKDLNRNNAMNYTDSLSAKFNNAPKLSPQRVEQIIKRGKEGEDGLSEVKEILTKPIDEEQKQYIAQQLKINL